jgi:hypothetical protein
MTCKMEDEIAYLCHTIGIVAFLGKTLGQVYARCDILTDILCNCKQN